MNAHQRRKLRRRTEREGWILLEDDGWMDEPPDEDLEKLLREFDPEGEGIIPWR